MITIYWLIVNEFTPHVLNFKHNRSFVDWREYFHFGIVGFHFWRRNPRSRNKSNVEIARPHDWIIIDDLIHTNQMCLLCLFIPKIHQTQFLYAASFLSYSSPPRCTTHIRHMPWALTHFESMLIVFVLFVNNITNKEWRRLIHCVNIASSSCYIRLIFPHSSNLREISVLTVSIVLHMKRYTPSIYTNAHAGIIDAIKRYEIEKIFTSATAMLNERNRNTNIV